ncbi:MAG: hypothetical protein AAGC74_07205 [Verrucomicrobiota bacterium]
MPKPPPHSKNDKNLCALRALRGECFIPNFQVIHDLPADGPANMQRDLDLLESLTDEPVLRLYSWSGNWASYGYFQKEPEVRAHFTGHDISLVQRPTGGGIVDHRQDFTYSLILPKTHPLLKIPRSHSYCEIHKILQKALPIETILASESTRGPACFQAPVPGDLLDSSGNKIAGAAQRRTRQGLLHQGSLLINQNHQALAQSLQTAFS